MLGVWLETDDTAKYGVAIHNFHNSKSKEHRLALDVGDAVNIISHCDVKDEADNPVSGWYYGYCTKDFSKKGIFPKQYVCLRESVVDLSGYYLPKELPIVQEITAVLREWGLLWKDLYLHSKGKDKSDSEVIEKTMQELIDFRRLIMSRKLTVDELKDVQQRVTNKIDMGNARLGLDLVVRDDRGNVIDPLKTSTIGLYRMHQLATKRIEEEKELMADRHAPKKTYSFNLYVNVKNFVCRIGENADILMTLYDVKDGQFISDNYIMKWGNQGMPKDLDMLNNLRVIFTDLSVKDTTREKVFLVCQIIRIGRMDLKETDSKKLTKGMRRPFGVAAIEVNDVLNGKIDTDEEKQYFIPFLQCGEHDFMDTIIKKAILAKDINHKGQGLWVTMRKLLGDLGQVQKEYPHLVTPTTAVARKMGFPDVIMPGDVRNDLYVTLKQGEFRKGGKMADKNVEVTLTVCKEDGEVIQGVISEGAGGDMVSKYTTIIYYHEDRPRWFETVKLAIPINDCYGAHLKFTMKHRSTAETKDRSEKNFAMSYVKLMNDNGTTLSDTDHDLLVYKIDSRKPEETSDVYFKLPSTQKELQRTSLASLPLKQVQMSSGSFSLTSDSFQISTLICSTKLTHNVFLMGLLKWRDNPKDLENHLRSFMTVDGEEVVKFLQDTLDALFNILMENSDSDLYDNLVFDSLVFLLAIVSDHKYSQFRPVLDVYINDTFSATLAYNKLMVVLKFYIEDVTDLTKADALMRAMRSLDYIFKFIIYSRMRFAHLNDNRGKQQFEISLCQLFDSINKLIKDAHDITLGVCGMVLNAMPTVISDVVMVYNPMEFCGLLIEFINSVPKDRLTLRKMHCINDFVHSSLFRKTDCRRILLPVMLNHVQTLMSNHVDLLKVDSSLQGDLSKQNELEICIKILSDIMDLLFKSDIAGTASDDLIIISFTMLRTVTQTVIFLDKQSSLIGNCVAVLTSILRQMTEYHYTKYINQFETGIDLMDFLMEILMVIEELVKHNVYPADWNEMIMLQNRVFLGALRYFSNTVRDRFLNPFFFELWKRFFLSSIAFLAQKPLQLEDFSAAKRIKILSRYNDMRRESGLEIRSMWYNLGGHKIEFIPEIVGPILEMSLIPEKELRRCSIPIFFDMMQCEFMSYMPNSKSHKRSFIKFEEELISCLDELVTANHGDQSYQEMFHEIMITFCEGHKTMREQGLQFVDTVKKLLQLLLAYRAVVKDENQENKMSCTVNLLNFYHDIERRGLYIRYLLKLCDLHLESDNFTEAAYTLLQYAKLLQWTDDPLSPMLVSSKFTEDETHRKLKENLYYEIILHFDQGKMWEKGIELCKELALQYETEIFDYLQLSIILKKQAELYDSIMTKVRPEPEYFRVGYYGTGYPLFLQNRTFIYRGKEYERLSDFVARLQNQFPNAQLMKTLNPPSEDIKQQPIQYLQINKVTPIMELKEQLANKQLREQILRYYKVNEVQKFTYSRKRDDTNNEMSSMWLERTILVTSYPLPGILRCFPVTSTQTFEVSPLELAIETIDETNQKLSSLVDQSYTDPSLRIDTLGMVLHGVVDAAVNGGIANYKVFYSEEYLKQHTSMEEQHMIAKLRHSTTLQLVILKNALDIHREKAPDNLKPFQAHLEQKYCEMKAVLEKEYGIKMKDEDYLIQNNNMSTLTPNSVKRVQSMPASRHMVLSTKQNFASMTRSNVSMRAQMPQSQLLRSKIDSVVNQGSTLSLVPHEVKSPQRTSLNTSVPGEPAGTPPQRKSSTQVVSVVVQSKAEQKDGSLIELSQELTPMRPLRPESEYKNRPASNNMKQTMTSMSLMPSPGLNQRTEITNIAKSSVSDYDEPPPLPDKSSHADYANVGVELAAAHHSSQYESVLIRKGTHRDRPQLPLPTTPTQKALPPKTKIQKEFVMKSPTPSHSDDENGF